MYSERRVLAVVPARGGSKGLPLKNLQCVQGISLVAKVGQVLQQLPAIDRSIVSTDHDEIARVSQEAGLSVPFLRPSELSGDRVGDWDVLNHALQAMEECDGVQYDLIVMLQPTSPMRTSGQVEGAIELLLDKHYDSVWTVSKIDLKYHPLKLLRVVDGDLDFYDNNGATIIARQQLSELFYRNGAAYVMTRECILDQKTIKGKSAGAYVDENTLISIDTLKDLELVEYYMNDMH